MSRQERQERSRIVSWRRRNEAPCNAVVNDQHLAKSLASVAVRARKTGDIHLELRGDSRHRQL